MLTLKTPAFLRSAAAALSLCALTAPALAEITVCTAQGNCATVDACEIVGDQACASDDDTGNTHCYTGGACYGNIAAPGASVQIGDKSRFERATAGNRGKAVTRDFTLTE